MGIWHICDFDVRTRDLLVGFELGFEFGKVD